MENKNTQKSHFVRKLEAEFLDRIRKNPRYSLRAFAQFLGINDSSLSKIMRGQRELPLKKREEIGFKLGLTLREINQLSSETKKFKKSLEKSLEFQKLKEDQYDICSQWYYSAILEMTAMDDFFLAPKNISAQLGVPYQEIQIALDKLMRAKYLIRDNEGKWVNNMGNVSTIENLNFDHIVFKQYQKQLRELAIESIDKDSASEKDHTSYISVMDKDLIPVIKKEIRDFHKRMADLIDTHSKKKDCVSNIQVSFFLNTKEIQNDKI